MIPSTRLWLFLTLLAVPTVAVGFFPVIRLAVVALDALVLSLAVLDWALARRVRLEVTRVLPARLQVGVANRIELRVVQRGGQAVVADVKDDAPFEFDVSPELQRVSLAPHSRLTREYRATPRNRGRFGFGDLHVRVHGPLGLVAHERTTPQAVVVSVVPDMRGASRLLLSDAVLDFVNLGLRQLRRDGRGSEFARLRDYAQGDSVRDVDWKATARRGRPVTRVMESERSQTVIIGLDAGRAMAAKVDALTKLDHAVNAALFLAFVAVKNGDRVGLVVFADGVKSYLPPAAGRAQYRRLADALYDAKPSLTYVDYLSLLKELNTRLSKRSLLCLFTDILDEDQAQGMVDPLRRLARRHVPLCLTVKDAAVEAMLRTPPKDAEVGYQHAVASELILEREAMKRRIGQDGVTLVDVDSTQLNLAAVNAYLSIKARGTL